jgi:hypothetical protein
MKLGRIWNDSQLVGIACGGALLPVPTVPCPLPVYLVDDARPCFVEVASQPAH